MQEFKEIQAFAESQMEAEKLSGKLEQDEEFEDEDEFDVPVEDIEEIQELIEQLHNGELDQIFAAEEGPEAELNEDDDDYVDEMDHDSNDGDN